MTKKVLAACLLLLFSMSAAPLFAANLQAIDQATLENLIRENRGKVVLLNFFATWCPPCKVEIPELVRIRQDFSAADLLVIGLSVDEDLDEVLPFTEKNGVNYPIYKADKSVTDHFDISSVPHNAFFAKDGEMVISEPGMADSEILQQVIDDLLARK